MSQDRQPPKPRPVAGGDAAWQRRKRLAEVFGDTLPETTSDEREPDAARERSNDDWLRSQVPPHHGS